MGKRIVVGIHISNRVERVPDVQALLTEYGCYIKTRLGLHQVEESMCSTKGLLICEMCGEEAKTLEFESKLMLIPGVTVKHMVFDE